MEYDTLSNSELMLSKTKINPVHEHNHTVVIPDRSRNTKCTVESMQSDPIPHSPCYIFN